MYYKFSLCAYTSGDRNGIWETFVQVRDVNSWRCYLFIIDLCTYGRHHYSNDFWLCLSLVTNIRVSSPWQLLLLFCFVGTQSPIPIVYASINWVSVGSDSGLSPIQRQAITWTIADLLSIGPFETNFNEIWIMHLIMSSAKWPSFRPGRHELTSQTRRLFLWWFFTWRLRRWEKPLDLYLHHVKMLVRCRLLTLSTKKYIP